MGTAAAAAACCTSRSSTTIADRIYVDSVPNPVDGRSYPRRLGANVVVDPPEGCESGGSPTTQRCTDSGTSTAPDRMYEPKTRTGRPLVLRSLISDPAGGFYVSGADQSTRIMHVTRFSGSSSTPEHVYGQPGRVVENGTSGLSSAGRSCLPPMAVRAVLWRRGRGPVPACGVFQRQHDGACTQRRTHFSIDGGHYHPLVPIARAVVDALREI
jgi:hypothetical protein